MNVTLNVTLILTVMLGKFESQNIFQRVIFYKGVVDQNLESYLNCDCVSVVQYIRDWWQTTRWWIYSPVFDIHISYHNKHVDVCASNLHMIGIVSADGGRESPTINWKTARASNNVIRNPTFSPDSEGNMNVINDITVKSIEGNSMLST